MALTKRERIQMRLLQEYFSRAIEPVFNGADDPEANWRERIDAAPIHHIEYAIDYMSRWERLQNLLARK